MAVEEMRELLRLYRDSLDAPTRMAEVGESEGNKKAFALVEALGADKLKRSLAHRLKLQLEIGQSQYTEHEFLDAFKAACWALHAPSDQRKGDDLRKQLLVFIMQCLRGNNEAASAAADVCAVLLRELQYLQVDDLPLIINELLGGLSRCQQLQRSQSGDGLAVFHSIELLPQLLLRVSQCPELSLESSVYDFPERCSGSEYNARVLEQLLEMPWPKRFFLQVLKTFRDFSFNEDQERLVCVKMFHEVRNEIGAGSASMSSGSHSSNFEQLPTVFYNVLLLVMRMSNALCKKILVRLLLQQCDLLAKEVDADVNSPSVGFGSGSRTHSEREVRALQSTILYHLDLVLKQNESVAKLFLMDYETSAKKLSSFDVALLLTISSVGKYEAKVTNFLMQQVVLSFTPENEASSSGSVGQSGRASFLQAVVHARDGSWSSIMQRLTQFAFQLMEFRGKKIDGARRATNGSNQSSGKGKSDAMQWPWINFAIRLLLDCFQDHESMREQILDRIVNTIIVQKDGTKTALLLLSRLIKRNPLDIDGKLEARIHECLEYVIHMKPENAQVLFSALSPLLKVRASMKNFVILTLRKAMFRKDEASRMIAIQGFSFMLCLSSQIFNGRATLTQLYSQNTGHLLSQGVGVVGSSHLNGLENEHDLASQDQANAIVAEDLFRQFCGIFKRALQLQTDVRISLYAELLRVFRQCPTLQPSILELVFQHYLKYYNANESMLPPLKVDSCLAHKRGAYEEPMAYLVHVMLACVDELRQANAQGDDDMMIDDIIPATQTASAQKSFGEVDRNVTVLMERLKRCELSDFELDKSSSFSVSTDSGATNGQIGKILLGVWETCMNWTITSSDGLEINDSTWLTLIHYMHLHHWITEKLDESDSNTKASDSSERKRGRPPGKGKKAPAKGSERVPGPHASASDKSDRAVVFAEHADLKDALLLAPSSVAAFLASALGKMQAVPLELSAEEEALISFMVHQVRQPLDVVLSRSVGDFDLMVLGTSLSSEAKGLVDRLGPSLLGLFCAFHNRDSAEPTPALKKDDPHERSRRIRCESLRLFVRIVRLWVTRSIEEAADCISRALRLAETQDDSDLVGDSATSQLESCVAIFLRLFDDLSEKTLLEEAAIVLEIIEAIWSKLPSKNMRKYEAWMKTALTRRNFPMQQRLVENMVRLFLQPHPVLTLQSPFALQLANGLLFIRSVGKPSKIDEAPTVNIRDRLNLSKLDEKNIVAVAGAVLSKVEQAIAELDADIKTFNSQHVRVKYTEQDAVMLQTLEDDTGTAVLGSLHASSASNATYKDLCLQLYLHSGTMTPFTMMNVGKATLCSRILRLFSRLYKLLGVVITWRVRRKEASLPKFLSKLLNRTARDLSPMVLNFIGVIIDTEGEAKSNPGIAASVQAKLIPDVVFQMEQYDVALIKFSKLCKGRDFSQWCKIRLSRDFRFKEDLVKQTFEGEGDGDEQEKHTEDDEEEGSVAEGLGDADDADDAENDDTESAEDEDYPPTATAPADDDTQDESGPASKRARPSTTPT